MATSTVHTHLITIGEASRRLRKTETAVHAEIDAGRLQAYEHRGIFLIPEREVERFRESIGQAPNLGQGTNEGEPITAKAFAVNWKLERVLSSLQRRRWGRYNFDGKGIIYSGTVQDAQGRKDVEIAFIKPQQTIGDRLRWRDIVLLDGRMMVEFVEADGLGTMSLSAEQLVTNSKMLSVLRNPEGRLVKELDSVPGNYMRFEKERRLGIYDDLIKRSARKMSRSRVIVCRLKRNPNLSFEEDKPFQRELRVMVEHALLRLRDLEIRTPRGMRIARKGAVRKRRQSVPDDTYFVEPEDEESLITILENVAFRFAKKFGRPYDDHYAKTTDRATYKEAWFELFDRRGEFVSIGFEPGGSPLYWCVPLPHDPKIWKDFVSKGYKKEDWYCWRYLTEVKKDFAELPSAIEKERELFKLVSELLEHDSYLRRG